MDYPFIPLPKWFIPLCPLLSGTEIKVMLVIFDQTIGWAEEDGSRQTTNILAYTFLQNQTGIKSRTAIAQALKSLEIRGLIKREPRRMSGQRIEVSIVSPIVPIELVQKSDSGVHKSDSQSLDSRLSESEKVTHIKKQQKEPFKETTTPEKLTPAQEESLALLLLSGIDSEIARRLILIAWENGHDSQYITDILGYVADMKPKKPAGYIRRLIERNNRVNPTSNGAGGPTQPLTLPSYHYYDNGGPELISHRGPRENCPICEEV